MSRFFDASALVKRYVREAGSVAVDRWLHRSMAVSRWSAVEIASALLRRAREGALSIAEVDRALAALDSDLAAFEIIELTEEITVRGRDLMRRHPLRAGDAVQLASCLDLGERTGDTMTMVTFDRRLRDAARLEGLPLLPRPPRRAQARPRRRS